MDAYTESIFRTHSVKCGVSPIRTVYQRSINQISMNRSDAYSRVLPNPELYALGPNTSAKRWPITGPDGFQYPVARRNAACIIVLPNPELRALGPNTSAERWNP